SRLAEGKNPPFVTIPPRCLPCPAPPHPSATAPARGQGGSQPRLAAFPQKARWREVEWRSTPVPPRRFRRKPPAAGHNRHFANAPAAARKRRSQAAGIPRTGLVKKQNC